jgi:hypothetical protein
MPSSEMCHRVDLVRSDVSGERVASKVRLKRINELATTLVVTSSWSSHRSLFQLIGTDNVVPSSLTFVTLMMEAISSSETAVLTRAIRRHIQEDGIFHSHRRENLKSYTALTDMSLAEK